MIRAITGTEDDVRRLIIDVKDPLHALESIDRLLKTDMITPKDYNYAVLCEIGVSKFFNQNDPRKYVLKFRSKDKTEEVWISGLSVGNRGTGSQAALQILLIMGFDVDAEQDVFHLARGVKKIFKKN